MYSSVKAGMKGKIEDKTFSCIGKRLKCRRDNMPGQIWEWQ